MSAGARKLSASRQVMIALLVLAVPLTLPLWVSAYVLGVLTIAYYFGVFACPGIFCSASPTRLILVPPF